MKTNEKLGRFFRDIEKKLDGDLKKDFEVILETGNFPLLQHFLEEHDLIHFIRDAKGNSVLHLMAGHTVPKNLYPLINEGLDIMAENDKGETPLHLACSTYCISNVKMLIDNGADYQALDYSGNSPLHTAALNGRMSIVDLLVELGTDIHLKNKNGYSAIDLAISKEHYEIAAKYTRKSA